MTTIEQFYDHVGSLYDWAERFEGKAKARAFERFVLTRGDRVLNVGAGTGIDHARLARHVGSDGIAVALDVSEVMLRLTRERTGQPVVRADARNLPFRDTVFDGLFCSYTLDLIPTPDLDRTVREFWRVLKPGGQIALVTMSSGITPLSRATIALWNGVYKMSPIACGGCRPIELIPLLKRAGFHDITHEVIVEAGFPSQVVLVRR